PLDEDLPPGTLAFPHMVEASLLPRLRSFVALSELTGEGGRLSRRSFPASLHSPCDLLAKPGILGVCVPRTSTFQGQLFHHRFASAGSYAPTARRPPVRATGLRAFALRPFHPRAPRPTLHRPPSSRRPTEPAAAVGPGGHRSSNRRPTAADQREAQDCAVPLIRWASRDEVCSRTTIGTRRPIPNQRPY